MRRGHAQDLSGLLGQAGPTHNQLPELRHQTSPRAALLHLAISAFDGLHRDT
jgi:hypothetical protein